MAEAVWPHRSVYITPMAPSLARSRRDGAGAGQGSTLDKAYVNDGGDIAIHLTPA